MVHSLNLSGEPEEYYAKLVFMCMVSAIVIGGPLAGIWVANVSKDASSGHIDLESPPLERDKAVE